MENTLQHGFKATHESHRLYLDIPLSVTTRIQTEYPALATQIAQLSHKSVRLIDTEPVQEGTRLYVNTKKIGNQQVEEHKRSAAKAVMSVLDKVYGWSDSDELDPMLRRVEFDMEPIPSDGRIGMFINLTLPEFVDDNTLTNVANYYMRDTAKQLRYPNHNSNDLAFADIDRTRGINLSSTGLGNGGLCTDASQFDPNAAAFELDAHNMYNSLEQLICFAGVIALANANTLQHNLSR